MDYLVTIKGLLGIVDTSKDALLNFYIADVQQTVMNYCGLTERNRQITEQGQSFTSVMKWPQALYTFPTDLEYWLVKKVIAMYNAAPSAATAETTTGAVSSIKRGDFSVSYGNSESGGIGFGGATVNLSKADEAALNPFRIITFM